MSSSTAEQSLVIQQMEYDLTPHLSQKKKIVLLKDHSANTHFQWKSCKMMDKAFASGVGEVNIVYCHGKENFRADTV